MKSSLIFLASILAVVFSSRANAQCTGSLVGTWRLVSVTATTDKGDVDKGVLGLRPAHLYSGWPDDGDHFRRWPETTLDCGQGCGSGRRTSEGILYIHGLRREIHVHLR
jgi:hypothetical protein